MSQRSSSLIARPACAADINSLVDLANRIGPGMTTLPSDPTAIAHKVECSVRTFNGQDSSDPQYLLVLEEEYDGRIVALSGVYPKVGEPHGFFSYKLTKIIQRSDRLDRSCEVELLTLSNQYTGSTEVGTLAVLPEFQSTGAGRFLAQARYMLIGTFPTLFSSCVMAEMRGWQDKEGNSPFWNAIGAKFFGMTFEHADRLSALEGSGFIADLMPKQPIYAALLPDSARDAIGCPHAISARVMTMLFDEDFRYDGYIDVFDGGPQVHALQGQIRTIRQMQDVIVTQRLSGEGEFVPMLICNKDLKNFRVASTVGRVERNQAYIDSTTICELLLNDGSGARMALGEASSNRKTVQRNSV